MLVLNCIRQPAFNICGEQRRISACTSHPCSLISTFLIHCQVNIAHVLEGEVGAVNLVEAIRGESDS